MIDLDLAARSLSAADPRLAALISRAGPCRLTQSTEALRFDALVTAITSQQLSSKAAETIFGRVRDAAGGSPIDPAKLLALPERRLREAGLSNAKLRSVRDLAERVHSGALDLHALDQMGDDAIIETLVAVKGIGRWTAQMYLMFRLGRSDILPIADLGVQKGILRLFGLHKLPSASRLEALTEHWRPYRSIASWYLWRLVEEPDPRVSSARETKQPVANKKGAPTKQRAEKKLLAKNAGRAR